MTTPQPDPLARELAPVDDDAPALPQPFHDAFEGVDLSAVRAKPAHLRTLREQQAVDLNVAIESACETLAWARFLPASQQVDVGRFSRYPSKAARVADLTARVVELRSDPDAANTTATHFATVRQAIARGDDVPADVTASFGPLGAQLEDQRPGAARWIP